MRHFRTWNVFTECFCTYLVGVRVSMVNQYSVKEAVGKDHSELQSTWGPHMIAISASGFKLMPGPSECPDFAKSFRSYMPAKEVAEEHNLIHSSCECELHFSGTTGLAGLL